MKYDADFVNEVEFVNESLYDDAKRMICNKNTL